MQILISKAFLTASLFVLLSCQSEKTENSTLSATSNSSVYEKIGELQRELAQNYQDLSDSDLRQIESLLDDAIEVAAGSGSSQYTPECIQTATQYGFRKQAPEICKRATKHSKTCIITGNQYGVSSSHIVELCGQRPSEFVAKCTKTARQYGMNYELTAKLCGVVRNDPSECIITARQYGLQNQDVATACRLGNEHSKSCIQTARQYGLQVSQAAEVCQRPNANTKQCIITSKQQGLSNEKVVDTCK